MKKAVIFGATDTGKRIYQMAKTEYHIIGFADGNPKLWGSLCEGYPVSDYKKIKTMKVDNVIIGVLTKARECRQQLLELGIPEYKIIEKYVEIPNQARVNYLEAMARLIYENKVSGSVAEAGVYRGDFAKYINQYFSDRTCYLFDTFEGLPAADISSDGEKGYTAVKEGHFSDTSMQLVLDKMPYKEKCIMRKGYFPESAAGIEDNFCFVSLDLDLYQPTLEGLRYFYPRLSRGGGCSFMTTFPLRFAA